MAYPENSPISSDDRSILAGNEEEYGRSSSSWFDYPHSYALENPDKLVDKDEPKYAMTPLPKYEKQVVKSPLKPKGFIALDDGPAGSLDSSTLSAESRIDVDRSDSHKKEMSLTAALAADEDCGTPINRISLDLEIPPSPVTSTSQESNGDVFTLIKSAASDPSSLQRNTAGPAPQNFIQEEVRPAPGQAVRSPFLLPRIVTCYDPEEARENEGSQDYEQISRGYDSETEMYRREGTRTVRALSSTSSTGTGDLITMDEGQLPPATGVSQRHLSPCGKPPAASFAFPALQAPASTVQVEPETAMDRSDSPWCAWMCRCARKEKCDEVEDIETPRSEKLRKKILYDEKRADIWADFIKWLIFLFLSLVVVYVLTRVLHVPYPASS